MWSNVQTVFEWFIRSSYWILITSLGMAVVFLLSITGYIRQPFGESLTMTLEFLFGLSSPKTYIKSLPGLFYYLAWAISFFGWIFIPLTIGIVLDLARRRGQRLLDKSLHIAILASALGLPKEKQKAFEAGISRLMDEILDQVKQEQREHDEQNK